MSDFFNNMMEKKKTFDLKEANFAYLFVVGSFFCIAFACAPFLIFNSGLFFKHELEITTVLELAVYVPLIIYILKSNTDIKSAMRIKGLSFRQVILTLSLAAAVMILVYVISIMWSLLLSLTGADLTEPSAMRQIYEKPLWVSIPLLCLFAPFFEEIVFRGIMLSGYSAYKSAGKAAIITGILFGMLHGFLPSVVPVAFCGVMLALTVIYTGSIFAGMIFHAVYNLLAFTMVVDTYLFDLPWQLKLMSAAESELGGLLKFIWIAGWAVIAVIAVVFILRALKKGYAPETEEKPLPEGNKHRLLLGLGITVAVILIILSSLSMYIKIPFA